MLVPLCITNEKASPRIFVIFDISRYKKNRKCMAQILVMINDFWMMCGHEYHLVQI